MKNLFLATALLFAVTVLAPRSASAQQYTAGGQFNGCVTAAYGGSYNWLEFTNNCNQSLNIHWFWRNHDNSGSAGDARPGSSVDTGMSASEVRGHGGYELYVCPQGYIAVTGSGSFLSNGGSNPQPYKCKKEY